MLNTQAVLEGSNDARTGMPSGIPEGAICVQRFDDSRNSAIHITYRISLRSSSMPEPRDPLLKVLNDCAFTLRQQISCRVQLRLWWARARELRIPRRPHGGPTKATGLSKQGWPGERSLPFQGDLHGLLMILPQVHLRNGFF
jgi:hypothetical protein